MCRYERGDAVNDTTETRNVVGRSCLIYRYESGDSILKIRERSGMLVVDPVRYIDVSGETLPLRYEREAEYWWLILFDISV
jgi:hypothetical protein